MTANVRPDSMQRPVRKEHCGDRFDLSGLVNLVTNAVWDWTLNVRDQGCRSGIEVCRAWDYLKWSY